jgi:hypothetical protein
MGENLIINVKDLPDQTRLIREATVYLFETSIDGETRSLKNITGIEKISDRIKWLKENWNPETLFVYFVTYVEIYAVIKEEGKKEQRLRYPAEKFWSFGKYGALIYVRKENKDKLSLLTRRNYVELKSNLFSRGKVEPYFDFSEAIRSNKKGNSSYLNLDVVGLREENNLGVLDSHQHWHQMRRIIYI